MSVQIKYHHLLTKIINAYMVYHAQYETSPTITELSKMIGASEEHILESMEFGSHNRQVLC